MQKTVNGTLPSGEAYASIYGAQGLFDYSFTFEMLLKVSPQAIVELMKLNKITDDNDLTAYLEAAAATIAQKAASYILNRAEANTSFKAEGLRRDEILRGIQIYKDFPEIDVSVFAIKSSKLPDYNMYRKLSSLQENEFNPSFKASLSDQTEKPEVE